MSTADQSLIDLWLAFCDALQARTDIAQATKEMQQIFPGYFVQWAVTGTFCTDLQGWAQQQLHQHRRGNR